MHSVQCIWFASLLFVHAFVFIGCSVTTKATDSKLFWKENSYMWIDSAHFGGVFLLFVLRDFLRVFFLWTNSNSSVCFFLHFCRTKKRVIFADDKGKSLTEVRVMSEPSNVPPLWSIEFLSHVTQGFITPDITDEWSVSFKQPASDYLNFR